MNYECVAECGDRAFMNAFFEWPQRFITACVCDDNDEFHLGGVETGQQVTTIYLLVCTRSVYTRNIQISIFSL